MILDVIERLAATSKKKEKESILSSLDQNTAKLFVDVAKATYDSSISYYIKSAPMPDSFTSQYTLKSAIDALSNLSERKVTGFAASAFLTSLMGGLNSRDAQVISAIVANDLRCGVTATTVNKVFGKGTIYQHPYNRCTAFSKEAISNIALPWYSQTKEDGLYVDIVVKENDVSVMTRSGQLVNKYINESKKSELLANCKNSVLQGEALVLRDDGSYEDRKTGNGYLNRDDVDPSIIVFVVWDCVPLAEWENGKSKQGYKDRFSNLQKATDALSFLRLVDTVVCNTIAELIDHLMANLLLGKEGTVVKSFTGKWSDGTSKDQIKLKVEFEIDLEVVSVNEGTGRNKGRLGSINFKSSCGLLTVSAGSGFSDKQRVSLYDIKPGTICTLKANDLVTRRTDDNVSLFLPRFIEVRNDKTEADSLETVKKIRSSCFDVFAQIREKQ